MPSKRVAFHHILCPTDFSELSHRALERAVGIARWFGAPLTALHVIPLSSPALLLGGAAGGGYAMVPEDLAQEDRRAAAEALRRCVTASHSADMRVRTTLLEGDPAMQIEATAEALSADLVVMGTHGRSGWDRVALGSVAERVMRRVGCPVLTVGPKGPLTAGPLFHRIVCATDLTPASSHTLDLALSLAQESLAHITLLHVVEGRLGQPVPHGQAWAADEGPANMSVLELAQGQLYRAGLHARPFCHVTERVETGSAWREIVRVAHETAADLIVVGAQATGGLGRLFLGSTASQVLRHAACPVLIARERRPFEEAGVMDSVVTRHGEARLLERRA